MTKKGHLRLQGAYMTAVGLAITLVALGSALNYPPISYAGAGIFLGLALILVVACLYVGVKLLVRGEE